MRAVQDYSGLFWSRTSGSVLYSRSWPSRACWRGRRGGPNWGMVHRARPTAALRKAESGENIDGLVGKIMDDQKEAAADQS